MLLDFGVSMLQLRFERGDAVRVLFEGSAVNANRGDDVEVVHNTGKN